MDVLGEAHTLAQRHAASKNMWPKISVKLSLGRKWKIRKMIWLYSSMIIHTYIR